MPSASKPGATPGTCGCSIPPTAPGPAPAIFRWSVTLSTSRSSTTSSAPTPPTSPCWEIATRSVPARPRLLASSPTPSPHLALYGAPPESEASVRRPSLAKTRLYLHLTLADLLDHLDHGTVGVGEVEKLGPATVAKIKEWLGASRTVIVPVLDLARDDAIDQHDPPDRMRETVILRDRHCMFPWCGRDARSCDLDHVEPYLDPDQGGPPGQTRPSDLAPLCRRHHRAKTARHWRYRRNPDGTYTWH